MRASPLPHGRGSVSGMRLTQNRARKQAGWFLLILASSALAQSADRSLLVDWAGLTRYGSENSELKAPKPGENRVVFLGDQITENWPEAAFFPGQPYLNRGIAHQTRA